MLVGRDALLNAGDRAIQDALRGRGRLLLLAGEAGIGKTTLATAMAERAASSGAVVRAGACWDTESLPPFTPWLQALRLPGTERCASAATQLEGGALDPTDASGASRALGRRFADVVHALREEAAEQPQVLLLEDLHWADEPSLELLTAVAAHLPAMGVLVIGTYRADELPPGDVFDAMGGSAERLWLSGLDEPAVGEVLAEVLGRAPSASELAQVVHQTSGNPLFITQVAHLLDSPQVVVPSSIRGVIDRRLARVSADCDRVLGAAAVLGADFDAYVLEAMIGTVPGDALASAAHAGLLVQPDAVLGHWRFVHALVRVARYDRLGTEERTHLHRAALDVLQRRGGVSAATLAHHATRAGFDPAEPLPAELLVAAGDEALGRLAWSDATTSFERALRLAPRGDVGDAVRAGAWLGLGAARLRQGAPDVRAAFDEAATVARRLGRSDLLARAALGFGVGLGAFEVHLVDHHQIELLEEAAAALAPDDGLLPLVLARLSVALAFVDSEERRKALADRSVDLARAGGDPTTLGHALAAWCDAVAGPDATTARREAASEIVALAARADDLPLELLGRRLRVVALFEQNEYEALDQEIVAYERTAARLGDPLYSWFGELWRAARAHARGDLAEARERVARAAEVGEAGNSINADMLSTVFAMMAAIDQRDRESVDAMVTQMSTTLPEAGSVYPRITRIFADALWGDLDRARAGLDLVTEDEVAALPYDSEWASAMVQLAVAATYANDSRMAALLLPLLEPVADTACVEGIGAYTHGSVRRFLALLTAQQGDVAATRAHVAASLAAAVRGGALLEVLAELDGARALRAAGDPADVARVHDLARSAEHKATSIGLEALAEEAAALHDDAVTPVGAPKASTTPVLRRAGDVWAWTWHGATIQVRHAKGIADLAVLLERPGREVHVRELDGIGSASGAPGAPGGPASARQDVLDEQSVEQYRGRLRDLEDDLDEADRHGDLGRAERLAAERDALVEQLAGAFGLGGRARRLGSDPDERLRKAVSARVKASIERIEALHPELGNHLRCSVQTGFWCAYRPEHPTAWMVDRG